MLFTLDHSFLQPEVVDLELSAASQLADLRAIADHKIAPLQDAVELKIASKSEKELLAKWKLYRVELSRIDLQQPNVQFPSSPEQEG